MSVIWIFFKKNYDGHFQTQKHKISVEGISLKHVHCDTCNVDIHKKKYYNRHLQTQKHKKDEEGILGYSLENIE